MDGLIVEFDVDVVDLHGKHVLPLLFLSVSSHFFVVHNYFFSLNQIDVFF
jgi:hypothetical protein